MSKRLDDATIEEAVAVLLHELRVPLTVVQGTLEHIDRRGPGSPAVPALVRSALRQCAVANRVLERLDTAWSPIVPERTRVDLAALAAEVVDDLSTTVLARHRAGVEVDVRPAVQADPALVTELLCALLDNAAKYADPGTSISVAVTTAGEAAVVAVTDEGPGVPAEDAQRIFAPRARGPVGAPGSGLGLHVASQISRAHDGHLTVEAAPSGRGARFVLRLPLDREARASG